MIKNGRNLFSPLLPNLKRCWLTESSEGERENLGGFYESRVRSHSGTWQSKAESHKTRKSYFLQGISSNIIFPIHNLAQYLETLL